MEFYKSKICSWEGKKALMSKCVNGMYKLLYVKMKAFVQPWSFLQNLKIGPN